MTISTIVALRYAVYAVAGISMIQILGMSENELEKAYKKATGSRWTNKIANQVKEHLMSSPEEMKSAYEWMALGQHIYDTNELDKGERTRLNDLANENAENSTIGGKFTAHITAENASNRLDTGERTYWNDLANLNAEIKAAEEEKIARASSSATNASSKLDTGERSYWNDLANENAEIKAGWKNLLPNLETKPIETPSDDKPQEGTVIPPVTDGAIDVPQEGTVIPPVTDGAIDVPKQEEVVTPIPGDTTIDVPKEETTQPPTEEKKEEEDKIGVPTITDKTEENIEQAITYGWDMEQWIAYMENAQKKQWEREDKIRQEGYDREDSAYQRAVADMKKAGINPNLMNVQPADSGTGITNATGLDYAGLTKQMETTTNLLMKMIDREFQGDENTKKNFTSLISAIIQGMFMMGTFSK